jgi:hypothetical protein
MPGIGNARAQRQAAPGDAPAALQLQRHARHQRFVRIAHRAVALQRGGEHADAGVGDAQGLAAVGIALAFEQARSQQLDLEQVLARPAGGAPDLAQATAVGGGDGARVHPRKRSAHRIP